MRSSAVVVVAVVAGGSSALVLPAASSCTFRGALPASAARLAEARGIARMALNDRDDDDLVDDPNWLPPLAEPGSSEEMYVAEPNEEGGIAMPKLELPSELPAPVASAVEAVAALPSKLAQAAVDAAQDAVASAQQAVQAAVDETKAEVVAIPTRAVAEVSAWMEGIVGDAKDKALGAKEKRDQLKAEVEASKEAIAKRLRE
jgi:hypothetical protein